MFLGVGSKAELSHVVNASGERHAPALRSRRRVPAQVAKTLKRAGVTIPELEGLTREAVLALPRVGPWTVRQIERFRGRSFETCAPYWIARGIPATVAVALAAAGIRTDEQLRGMQRDDLLGIEGIGLHAAEMLLSLFGSPGKPSKPTPRTFLERMPQARIWVEAGIIPCCAARLVKAGVTSTTALAHASREDLLAIRGIDERTLEKCEELLGRPLRSITAYWREKGLPLPFANALLRAGIESVKALAALSREDLLRIPGLGSRGLQLCEELLGRPLCSHVEQWHRHGIKRSTAWRLVRAGVVSIDLLRARLATLERHLADDEIYACERITARRANRR